eukprot:3614550-Rhodomonas_salina.1
MPGRYCVTPAFVYGFKVGMAKGTKKGDKGDKGGGQEKEKEKEDRGGRAQSPTGSSDAAREVAALCASATAPPCHPDRPCFCYQAALHRLHQKLVAAFPHQPHISDLQVSWPFTLVHQSDREKEAEREGGSEQGG